MTDDAANGRPAEIYAERQRAAVREEARLDRSSRRYSFARVAAAATAIGLGVVASELHMLAWTWALLPVAVFVALACLHDGVIRRERRAGRRAAYYAAAGARLRGEWIGVGPTGEDLAEQDHPYARDLDVVGDGSLFQRLATTRTRAGEEILASWLLQPARPAEVVRRQEAVRELVPRLDLRESLALLGEDVRQDLSPELVQAWGERAGHLFPLWATGAALALTLLTTGTLLAWLVGWPLWPLLVALALQASFRRWQRRWMDEALAGLERPVAQLGLLAGLTARIEQEPARAPLLDELRRGLAASPDSASRRIHHLQRIAARLEYRRNMMFQPLDFLLLWSFHHATAVERWRRRDGHRLGAWLRLAGEYEAVAALATYAFENPEDATPELDAAAATVDARGLAHPLLPVALAVRNDVKLGGETRVWVVSGSNMSGKSTLLRAVGANVVLAQAGAPVRAHAMRLSPLAVGAAIRTLDSLHEGRSRFFAEITRLKQIVDLTEGELPVLFLLDELLHGTTSADRRVGAEALVRALAARGALGLVTTHDLALCRLAQAVPGVAEVHFEDALDGAEVRFDYVLRPGTVRRSNALALMRLIGLPVETPGT
ncbi:MAG: DNA mismatch repair protein MutS [Acidobacteria bacterium]|nr:DNA mismatch repair protein MutS [Acidobacteriota bacterium]